MELVPSLPENVTGIATIRHTALERLSQGDLQRFEAEIAQPGFVENVRSMPIFGSNLHCFRASQIRGFQDKMMGVLGSDDLNGDSYDYIEDHHLKLSELADLVRAFEALPNRGEFGEDPNLLVCFVAVKMDNLRGQIEERPDDEELAEERELLEVHNRWLLRTFNPDVPIFSDRTGQTDSASDESVLSHLPPAGLTETEEVKATLDTLSADFECRVFALVDEAESEE